METPDIFDLGYREEPSDDEESNDDPWGQASSREKTPKYLKLGYKEPNNHPWFSSWAKPPVCLVCEDLHQRRELIQIFDDISSSATAGCTCCQLLLDIFVACWPDFDFSNSFTSFHIPSNIYRADFFRFRVYFHDIPEEVDLEVFIESTAIDLPCTVETLRFGRPIYCDTGASDITPRAGYPALWWLLHCDQFHRSCRKGIRATLPKRILYLSGEDDLKPVVLYESKSEEAKYACLSHCWGHSRPLTLTKSTFGSYKRGIPIGSFPKTFREVITFLRRIGIRFLWIDSLCIVQDDLTDWEVEAAKMAQIYENAYVTIGASGSDGAENGLFGRSLQCVFSKTTASGTPYTVYACSPVRHYTEASSFFTRGWIFQERMLSPRVLYFGKEELGWECKESKDCQYAYTMRETNGGRECDKIEDYPRRRHKAYEHGCGKEKPFARNVYGFESKKLDETDQIRRWHDLVTEYSKLEITKFSDRLPAISGIARRMNDQRNDTYMAGLWKNSLLQDLLWYRDPKCVRKSPTETRGPSWSWGSLDSKIEYVDPVFEIAHVRVLEVSCQVPGANPLGAVNLGHIVLAGSLIPATLTTIHSALAVEVHPLTKTFEFLPDYHQNKSNSSAFDKTDVFILLICNDREGHFYSMVLKPVEGTNGLYERIGLLISSCFQCRDIRDDYNSLMEQAREGCNITVR